MQVRVLFFGILREVAGQADESLDLPEHAVLGDVLAHYETRIPTLRNFSPSLAMSINHEFAGPKSKLHAGDEVALLPPVSGGVGDGAVDSPFARTNCVEIVRERIDTAELLHKIKGPADGAVVVFEGVVRNNSRGRRTLFLDYEAYEEMALKRMNGLAEQAISQFQVREVAMVHRIGRLQLGETSVVVLVSSGHRAAAFEACRWVIDSLKRTVPIWKKEHFADGTVWADGDPFPADIEKSASRLNDK